MAEAAFVGVGRARTVGNHFGAARPGQASRGLHRFCRRTDGRHHNGSLLMIAGQRGAAGEHSRNMGQLRGGEGDHGIGAIGVRCEELASVRIPARRQIHGDHGDLWIAFKQVAAGDGQAPHWGAKAGAQNCIHKELSTLYQAFAPVTV